MRQPNKQWTKRRIFHDLCDVWLESHSNKTKDDLAHLMGMPDEKTWRQYYSGSQNPGRGRAKLMATVLDCGETDLLDEPDEPKHGIWDTVDIHILAETESMFYQARSIPPEKMDAFIKMLKKANELALEPFKKGLYEK